MNSRKTAIILAHVFIGWALERVMGAITTWTSSFFYTLGAVLIFVVVSWIYFKKFNYTTPWLTGIVFTGIIMAANFFEVAFLNNRFLELYASLPQTWLRFALIFVAIYLTGLFTTNGSDSSSTSKAKKVVVVMICAIISSLGSGVFGFFIDVWGWGWYESALFGAIIGFGVGLVAGIGWSIRLLTKEYSILTTIAYSLLFALLISGLVVFVSTSILAGLP